MNKADKLILEIERLRARLSKLSDVSRRITESLDLDIVLQEVVDGARSLTGARYGALAVFDDSGRVEDFITSGITPEERRMLGDPPKGLGLLGYMNEIREPLRLADIAQHSRSVGFPENHPAMKTFLGAPIRHLGEPVGNIYLTEKKGGQEFTVEDEETLVMFASQAVMAIANALRYGAERRVKRDMEVLVRTSPVGVLVVDAKTRTVVSINQEAERIIGVLPQPGITLKRYRELVIHRRLDGSRFPSDKLPLERALTYGETVRAEEVVFDVSDGRTVTTLINATPIYSEDGEIVSAVAVIQDMTPLEELERLRSEFLGMVSHELRTPLTSIKGSAATVLGNSSQFDASDMLRFFRIIDEQSDYLSDLISNLLDMTRIEAGTLSVTLEPTDVVHLVDEAKNTFRRSAARNVIDVDLAPDLPPLKADRRRMAQLLDNLLSNASKYSPEPSTIKVTALQEDLHVAISVTDDGRGVSADQLPDLFKKFTRIDSEDGKRKIAGDGLGLAICKGIVETHGGRIWAESDGLGHGTRFTFTIPVFDEAAPDTTADPAQDPNNGGRVVKQGELGCILAVDDDPQILRYVRNMLSATGYTPIVTGDPDEFLHLFEMEQPDLVLLDVVLPRTDGFKLMKRIREVSDVPVIFLSGSGGEETIVRTLSIGADDYIVKPFSPTELLARVAASLRKRGSAGATMPRPPYRLGDLTINYADRGVTVSGRPARLTPTEYKLIFERERRAGIDPGPAVATGLGVGVLR